MEEHKFSSGGHSLRVFMLTSHDKLGEALPPGLLDASGIYSQFCLHYSSLVWKTTTKTYNAGLQLRPTGTYRTSLTSL